MKDKKFFPIQTATACKSKWNWSTLFLTTGETSSCHRVTKIKISKFDFDSFHNLPKKIKDRELMLEGKWPSGGCEYCKNIEDAGGTSDRHYNLQIPDAIPEELFSNKTALTVKPKIIEVYLNNTCNLSCVYCNEIWSSKIAYENKKYGPIPIEQKTSSLSFNKSDQPFYFKKFCEWLDNNIQFIEELILAGGEPFYQKEYDTVIDIIKNKGHSNLSLSIISNLMVSTIPEKIERIKNIVLSKKLKKFKITASIDGIGSEQEYTRYGFKFQEFQKNLDFIVKQKWIEVNLNQTISSLTIKTIKNLYQQIYHKNDYHKVSITFGLVVGHPYLHPKIFGSNFWRKDAEEILSLMPENNEIQKISKGYMKSIFSFIESCDKDLDQIQNLKLYLDEIDRRRNLDWRKTFPYLDVKI